MTALKKDPAVRLVRGEVSTSTMLAMRGEVVFSLPTRRPFGLAQAGTSVAD
tara:strand:+ start:465 stop:617 length:153 start_codon:yes stop_codon:yes gene_type:complete